MKKYLPLFLISLLTGFSAAAQIVVMDPSDATGEDQVTITYDATQGQTELVGASKVYAHMGVVTDSPDGTDWTYVQGNWGADDGIGQMTKVDGETDKWEITLGPSIRDYFGVPEGTNIFRVNMVFRNADGSAKGAGNPGTFPGGLVTANGDIYLDLVVGEYITITGPIIQSSPTSSSNNIFVNTGSIVTFSASASNPVTSMSLFIDEGSGFGAAKQTVNSGTTISYDYMPLGPGTVTVKYEALINGQNVSAQNDYAIKIVGTTVTEARPAGIVKGINYQADQTKVTLSFFAPDKDWVYLIGDFNNWEIDDNYLMKKDGNYFWIELTGLTPQQPYVFAYVVPDGGGSQSAVGVGDPYADVVIDPYNDSGIPSEIYPDIPPAYHLLDYFIFVNLPTVIQTGQAPYEWSPGEDTWQRPDEEDLVIYELLVRDFTGSFKTLIDSLDYIQGLGVNAIELMPIMEFGGNDNWGYQPDYYMAPDKSYGTKDDLKALIEACHEKGMAVILDVVFNHADKNPYVFMYFDLETGHPSNDSPFFNSSPIPSCVSFFRDWNHESPYTVDLIDTTLVYWLREYHVDGYRFDVSHGFTQNNNCNGFDQSRVDKVLHYANTIWNEDPDAYVTLEHFSSPEVGDLHDAGAYTWAFSAKFRYQSIMKANPVTASISEAAFPGVIGAMENHDEQRLVYEAISGGLSEGDYNIKDIKIALERAKMAPAFFFTLPGPKLMWMFGELGYDIDIDYNGRVGKKPPPWGNSPDALGYYEDPERQKVYGVYSAIISLTQDYREVFRDGTLDRSRLNPEVKRISITHPTMDVLILGNWATSERTFDPEFTQTGEWYDFFSGEPMTVSDVNENLTYLPGEFHIYTTEQVPTPPPGLLGSTVTGLEDNEFSNQLTLYPNPTRSGSYIISETSTVTEVNVMSLSGSALIRKTGLKGQKVTLETWALPRGVYLVEIRDNKNRRTVQRLLKL